MLTTSRPLRSQEIVEIPSVFLSLSALGRKPLGSPCWLPGINGGKEVWSGSALRKIELPLNLNQFTRAVEIGILPWKPTEIPTGSSIVLFLLSLLFA